MGMLVAGLVLFVGIHLVGMMPAVRAAGHGALGDGPYKGLYSLVSLAGLGLMIAGWGSAPTDVVWSPPVWARHLAWTLVPLALVLVVMSSFPTKLGRRIGHPQLIGVALWAGVHLFANHELRAWVFFGAWGGFALVALAASVARDGWQPKGPPERPLDAVAIGAGLALAAAVAYFHGTLFGVAVI